MIGVSLSLKSENLTVNLVYIATPVIGDTCIVPPDGGLFNLIFRTDYDGIKYFGLYTLIFNATSSSKLSSVS